MRIIPMSLLMLSAGLLDAFLGAESSVIPTREEQANLLTNVQEVFEQVKLLVNVEANSTDESVVCDINRMAQRAKDKLILVEELALTRLSYNRNSVDMLDSRALIQDLVVQGGKELTHCILKGSEDVKMHSRQLTNVTGSATSRGQEFLDTLEDCSRKPGLQVINCYKKVIATDVIPVKNMLLRVIEEHKKAHLSTIQIRNEANDCIDSVMERYQVKIVNVLTKSIIGAT